MVGDIPLVLTKDRTAVGRNVIGIILHQSS